MKQEIKSNIWKYYAGALLGGFAFFYNAIDTLYYRYFELSFQQIGWIISASLISALILDIPSGAFADLYGKKKALVISAISDFIGTIFVALGSSFPLFLLGFAFWGAGRAFSSGASEALLFDTLKALGKERDYLKHTGRLKSFFISIDVLSGALAPLLFGLNVRLPYFVSLGAALLVVIIQFTLREVMAVAGKFENALKTNIQQVSLGIKVALKSKIFLWLTFFNLLVFTVSKALCEMTTTPFLIHEIGFTLQNLSVICIIGSLIQSGTVFFVDKFEHKLGDKRSFFLIVLAFPATMLFYAFSRNYLLTAFLSGIYFSVVSFSEAVVGNYLTHNVADDKRATILSISSMFTSLFALVSLPIIGSVVDRISLQNSIIMLSVAFAIIGLILLRQYKSKSEI
jgi:MFS family permease